jgi:hypothetical protein
MTAEFRFGSIAPLRPSDHHIQSTPNIGRFRVRSGAPEAAQISGKIGWLGGLGSNNATEGAEQPPE